MSATTSSRSAEIRSAMARILARREDLGAGITPEQDQELAAEEASLSTELGNVGGSGGLPPAHITGDMEAPRGEKDHGTFKLAVYDEEQQARLGVTETGAPAQPRLSAQSSVGGPQSLPAAAKKALPPAWITGGIEKPAGVRSHGSYTTLYYTEEQRSRLGVDEQGNKVEAPAAPKKALPPAWITGRLEKPAGVKDNGSYSTLFYTQEQQERLGVDAEGKKVVKALPPAHITGGIEAPAGEVDHGTYKTAAYTAEQQARLGVDAEGKKVVGGGNVKALPPAHITGGIEAPAGEVDHGTYTTAVYTEEQQARLGVDEEGNKVAGGEKKKKALPPAWLTGDTEKPAGVAHHGSFTTLVYTPEQQQRLGVDAFGQKTAAGGGGGAAKKGPEGITVGTTVHAPFAPYPGAAEEFNEYVTYSDDAALGSKCPDLSTLRFIQGDAVAVGKGRVTVVFFWGKYLKWQCWPTMIGMSELNEKYPEVDFIGIAADKKPSDVERFIQKGECRADVPLAFDENWTCKDAFRKVMKVGALAVPCAFLLDGEGTIVWRQAYSAGYPFATMGFLTQLQHLLAGEPLESHCANPNPEEDLGEDVEEAQDVFQTQEVKDAIW